MMFSYSETVLDFVVQHIFVKMANLQHIVLSQLFFSCKVPLSLYSFSFFISIYRRVEINGLSFTFVYLLRVAVVKMLLSTWRYTLFFKSFSLTYG